ncbi:glycosyltransferase family 4 protein [Microvirga sp. 2TAF3]|uniref:glycosyltransferase family 4 protein n=1 Tax=Microvirga sp. 2TAF3 TaxID=3233014 RepID=UPI003F9CDE03
MNGLLSRSVAPARNRNVLLWHWGQAGAGAKFTYELARELQNVAGINPALSAVEGSDLAALATSLAGMPIQIVRTFRGNKASVSGKLAAAWGVFGLPRLADRFQSVLYAQSTDVALCTMPSIWDVATLPALRRKTSRFIFILHDASFHPGDSYPFRETVVRWQIAAADGLIVLSDHVGRAAQALYDFPADRIWTIPHGAFAFGPDPAIKRTFPRNRPVRLLFFGRILAYKGLGHLLDAYRALREGNVAVELDIVGSGDISPYAARLETLTGISISNKWVDDEEIANALSKADIVVLPYIEASQSGVAASALTAGLPIVATPVGGLVEQVCDGQTGLVAKGMAVEDLVQSIQSLVEDQALYEACSAGALNFAHEELSWARIANSVSGIVDEVLASPRRKDR